MIDLLVFFIYGLLLALYLAPAFISHARGNRNWQAITALNILTGWTFVGWVISLVWALKND